MFPHQSQKQKDRDGVFINALELNHPATCGGVSANKKRGEEFFRIMGDPYFSLADPDINVTKKNEVVN